MKGNLIILLLLIIAGCSGNNKNPESGELKSGIIKNGGTTIYYLERGAGDTTLLFLHGWGINSSYWKSQFDHFYKKYKTIAPDLPGFGKSVSDRKNFTVEKYADDVIDFIHQKKLKNVILVGHSMSGDIALEAAVKNDKAIIGITGVDNFKFVGVQPDPQMLAQINSFMDSLKNNFRKYAADYAENFLFSPSTDSSVRTMVKNDYSSSDPEAGISSIQNVFKYDEPGKLQQLNYKLYLVNSDGMPTNAAGLEKYCKKSFEVMEIHGTGHFPMTEKPGDFNSQLQKVVYKIGEANQK